MIHRLISPVFSSSSAAAGAPDSALGALPVWDLSNLYNGLDDDALAADQARVVVLCAAFQADYKGRLEELAQSGGLYAAVKAYEDISELCGKVGSYSGLVFAQDHTKPENAKFYGDVNEKLTAASTQLLFFELELNRIEDSILAEALKVEPLARYAPWFAEVRKWKPYQLDDRTEELFVEKSQTSSSAWSRLFDESVAGLKFTVEGEVLNLEAVLHLLSEPEEAKRKLAFEALAATFKDNARLFTLIMNTLVKDKEISDRWHGYEDMADSRHMSNSVEREVVEALVAAVREAFPRLSHRYYALKAKWMGKEKLEQWDRNAPISTAALPLVPWTEAKDIVLSAYAGFDPEMARIAERFFDESWIDAPVRQGKSSGAFAHPTVPSSHPFVLVNYQGRIRDVTTLAHELGHGVHQVLAGPNGALMAPTSLTLAETASVFGEMLTFRSLVAKAASPAEKRTLILSKVEDMINTVVRQIAFYTFERKVHAARREGELTPDQINALWIELQSESLGPIFNINEGYETFWMYIGHFIHSPFYVYAYAFGDCLVNSLYAVYQKAEPGFQEKYFNLLKAGGSKPYHELLAPFGLDAKDPNFWTMGLSMIEGFISELEAMDA